MSLTTGVSDVAGPGAGADTIVGALTTAGAQTWQATDVIDGGAGVDTLTATLVSTNVVYDADTASNLTNVEHLVLTSTTGASTVTLGGATFSVSGIQSVTNTLSTHGLTVNGINNLVTVNVINNASTTNVVFADTVLAGALDTVTLNVNGATGAVTIGAASDLDGDYETLVINTSGAASSFAAAGLGADATNLTITGAGNLTLTGAAFANLGTLDASAATGDMSIVLAADTVASVTNTKTATFGSGDDSLDISAIDPATVGAVSVNMGSGDDTVILATRGASDFTINGGAGTDSISISVAGSAALHQGVSGFERLIVTENVTTDMVQFTSNSGFTTLRAANDADVAALQITTFTNVGASVTALELATANSAGTNSVSLSRLVDGASDSLAVVTRSGQTLNTLAIADEEVVSINSTRGALTLTSFTTTDMTSLTVSGLNAVNVGTSSGAKVATVDVSGLSAAFTGVFSASTAAMTVTGNGNVGASTLTITTGSGNDVITGGRLVDQITAGAGNDTVRGGRGDDAINITGGSNTLVFESTAAINGNDTITGFNGGTVVTGGDVLNFASFLSSGSVDQQGGSGTAITVYTAATNNDVNITGKVAILELDLGAAATEANIFAEINNVGSALSITAGGKAIVILGDTDHSGTGVATRIAFIDTTLTGTNALQVEDIVFVGNLGVFDVDALITANFSFA